MDVKLFSLCKQEVAESEAGKKCIFQCVKSFFPDCEGFAAFTSQKRMLLAISQSLRAADIVVVAVQSNMYNATKRLLSAALDLKSKKYSEVVAELNPLLEQGKIKQTTFDANIRFPVGAEILPTDSKLNCGFALTSGGQHIIYLPIEAPKAQEVVLGSLYDYFAEISDDEMTEKSFDVRHSAIIKRTADKLNSEYVKVAVAGSQAVKIIEYYSPTAEKSCFIFDENTSFSPYDHLINKTRALRDDFHSQLSVLVSDISRDENSERFIDAAIADESGTSTLRMTAEKDETDEAFIANCIDKIMLLLYDYQSLSNCVNEADITTKSDKALRRNLFKITSGAIGATAIISIIIALVMK